MSDTMKGIDTFDCGYAAAKAESQEQEPVAYIRASKGNDILWSEDCVAGDADCLLEGYEDEVAKRGYFAMPLYAKPVIIPESALQLHIKELWEALERLTGAHIRLLGIIDDHNIHNIPEDVIEVRLANEALAKQPDTRALDKALLEARIEELTFAYGQTKSGFIDNRIGRYEDKLAELNKEKPE